MLCRQLVQAKTILRSKQAVVRVNQAPNPQQIRSFARKAAESTTVTQETPSAEKPDAAPKEAPKSFSIHAFAAELEAFVKGKKLDQAKELFNQTIETNKTSDVYNQMIKALMKAHPKEALQYYSQMQKGNIPRTEHSYLYALQACNESRDLTLAHQILSEFNYNPDVLNWNNGVIPECVMEMYASSGKVKEAKHLFSLVKQKNTNSYTSMIELLQKNSLSHEAVQVYHQMEADKIEENNFTYLYVLFACRETKNLELTRKIQSKLKLNIWNPAHAFVSAYCACSQPDEAIAIFNLTKKKTAEDFHQIISTMQKYGFPEHAIELYNRLKTEKGTIPSYPTLASVLHACVSTSNYTLGKEVMELIVQHFESMQGKSEKLKIYQLKKMHEVLGTIDSDKIFANISTSLPTFHFFISMQESAAQTKKILQIYDKMTEYKIAPNEEILSFVAKAKKKEKL